MIPLYRKAISGHTKIAVVGAITPRIRSKLNSTSFIQFNSAQELLSQVKENQSRSEWDAVIAPLKQLEGNNFDIVEHLRRIPHSSKVRIISVGSINGYQTSYLKTKGIDQHFANYQNLIAHFQREPDVTRLPFDMLQWQLSNDFSLPIWKRAMDLTMACGLLILFSPVMILISLAILIERKGNIIYVSNRIGRGYRTFRFYKFQSMYQGADAVLFNYKQHNDYQNGSHFFKMKNDPRSTFVGKIIRKTSLDELPQLWNVIKGDMSIVGNRPLPLYEAEGLVQPDSIDRFKAPAGITGLWQVSSNGRAQVCGQERIALDLKYAREYSFWQDIKILAKTLPAMVQGDA